MFSQILSAQIRCHKPYTDLPGKLDIESLRGAKSRSSGADGPWTLLQALFICSLRTLFRIILTTRNSPYTHRRRSASNEEHGHRYSSELPFPNSSRYTGFEEGRDDTDSSRCGEQYIYCIVGNLGSVYRYDRRQDYVAREVDEFVPACSSILSNASFRSTTQLSAIRDHRRIDHDSGGSLLA